MKKQVQIAFINYIPTHVYMLLITVLDYICSCYSNLYFPVEKSPPFANMYTQYTLKLVVFCSGALQQGVCFSSLKDGLFKDCS